MDAGLLPVKAPAHAKSRLSPHFDDAQRLEIVWAMLDDALDLCTRADFLTWWVISDSDEVLAKASERGFAIVSDPNEGLNAALAAGARAALEAGATSVTIVPSDVPLAFEGDLRDVLDTGATSDIVLVPSEGDGGTNAMFLAPPDLLAPSFGSGSLNVHLALADQRGLRCALLNLPRLALDIDTIEDVDAFLARPKHAAGRTATILEKLRS